MCLEEVNAFHKSTYAKTAKTMDPKRLESAPKNVMLGEEKPKPIRVETFLLEKIDKPTGIVGKTTQAGIHPPDSPFKFKC